MPRQPNKPPGQRGAGASERDDEDWDEDGARPPPKDRDERLQELEDTVAQLVVEVASLRVQNELLINQLRRASGSSSSSSSRRSSGSVGGGVGGGGGGGTAAIAGTKGARRSGESDVGESDVGESAPKKTASASASGTPEDASGGAAASSSSSSSSSASASASASAAAAAAESLDAAKRDPDTQIGGAVRALQENPAHPLRHLITLGIAYLQDYDGDGETLVSQMGAFAAERGVPNLVFPVYQEIQDLDGAMRDAGLEGPLLPAAPAQAAPAPAPAPVAPAHTPPAPAPAPAPAQAAPAPAPAPAQVALTPAQASAALAVWAAQAQAAPPD
jgi:hypothetical protein